MYGKEYEYFLEKAGFLESKEEGEEIKRVPIKELIGGRWCYPSSSQCPALPTNPQSYIAFRCVQNFQVMVLKELALLSCMTDDFS